MSGSSFLHHDAAFSESCVGPQGTHAELGAGLLGHMRYWNGVVVRLCNALCWELMGLASLELLRSCGGVTLWSVMCWSRTWRLRGLSQPQ